MNELLPKDGEKTTLQLSASWYHERGTLPPYLYIRFSEKDRVVIYGMASPDVQVTQTPLSVISHLHMPIVRLQQHTIMPFIMTQQEHMPPCSMVHRFCIMLRAIWSSHTQVIFMPPWHFSNL